MNDGHKAVFLSYASQDAAAAKKICDALRAAGVEVWFDQSELRGGDAWDQKIRRQIKECALFLPIVSDHTNARPEGYFRLEWKLAVDRSHLLADDHPFLFPIAIGEVNDATARVPDKFRDVQWTRLRLDETPGELAVRVARVLSGAGAIQTEVRSGRSERTGKRENPTWLRFAWALVGLTFAVIYLVRPIWRERESHRTAPGDAPVPRDGIGATPAPADRGFPRDPELRRAWEIFQHQINATVEDFALAEDIVKAVGARRPADPEAVIVYAWLNDAYLNRGFDASEERYVLGRRYAERAVQLAPDDPEALAALGQFLSFRRADLARAEQLLRRAIELNPGEPRYYRALAYNVLRVLRPAEALPMGERAAELFPTDPLVLYELGLHYRDAGRLEDMERTFDRALALAPIGAAIIWKSWAAGWVHGDLAAMRHWLDQVPANLRLTDRALNVRQQFACVTREPADLAGALQALQAFPGATLTDFYFTGPKALLVGELYAALGQVDLARGQFEAAWAQLAREKALAPDDAPRLDAEFWTLLGLGRGDEARAVARLAQGLRTQGQLPRFVNWWRSLAAGYLLLGDREEALAELRRLNGTASLRRQLRASVQFDPRMAPWRDDPGIVAALAEPVTVKEEDRGQKAEGSVPIDQKSVAVLAFTNLSDDKANEYFSDGISEELLNVLAKVPGLKVAARTSAFYFKGREVPIPEIARQLGVAYVIEGSVRKQGDKVRITAQLIKAADGFPVWSDTFARDLKDIFAVQDEIAGLIAKNLSLKIGTSSGASAGTVNPLAFDLYVQARRAWNLRNAAGFTQAEELLTRALTLEPNFARAHAALADVWTIRAITDGVITTFGQREAPVFSQIIGEIEKALALDPDSSEAHASLGIARLQQWNLPAAERALRRAVELNPNYATGHHWLGGCLYESGWIEESLVERRRAVELDPFSPRILESYAQSLVDAGRDDEALTVLGRAEAVQPKAPLTLITKVQVLLKLGRRAEAIALARELDDTARAELLAMAGEKSEAKAALVEAEGWSRYELLTALGRFDEAIANLRAEDVPVTSVGNWLMDSRLDPFRKDPHFVELLSTLGLTEAHSRMQAWRAAHPGPGEKRESGPGVPPKKVVFLRPNPPAPRLG